MYHVDQYFIFTILLKLVSKAVLLILRKLFKYEVIMIFLIKYYILKCQAIKIYKIMNNIFKLRYIPQTFELFSLKMSTEI